MRVYEAKLVYSMVSLGEDVVLNRPEAVAAYLESAYAENPVQEAFYVILLDRKNRPLGRQLVSLGAVTGTLVGTHEIFRAAIIAGAPAIAVSHNHPSGDPQPSSADLQVTRRLREAANILKIDLLDHLIMGDKNVDPLHRGWYSFREAGLI